MAKVISLLRKLGLVHEANAVESSSIETSSLETPSRAAGSSESTPPNAASAGGGGPASQGTGSIGSIPPPRVVRLSSTRFDEAIESEPDAVPIEFPFEEIYTKAGVEDPEHGFTVYKLMEMARAEGMRDLDAADRARAIETLLAHLPGGGVSIEEIAADAARRDAALDAFEEFLGRRLADHLIEIEAENEQLQAEIDRVTVSHRQRIEANQATLAEETERFETWRQQKRNEEEKLHAAIAPFVKAGAGIDPG